MNSKNTICLLALACAFATGASAQDISSPTSKDDTDERIAARAQLTNVPTIYIWMLDAEVEYDENNNPVRPMEYKNTTGDKNDNYYLVKLEGGSSYDTPISNNIIAADPNCTNNVALRANYPQYGTKSDEYRLARIKVVDAEGSIKSRDELTTIRGRGNSTWNCDKKSYRLKFPSKTKFLAQEDGTNEYADAKNWTLLANGGDKSMLRNALTREVCLRIEEKTGVKALPFYPAYKFVDLVMNGEYMGTYQISDHTQIQTERINIDENNGWFLEGVSTNEAFIEDPHVTVDGLTVNVKNPEDEFYTTEVENAIKDYLHTIFSCGNSPYDFSEATGLFKYVDMESVVAYFIGNEISGNFDGLISNYAYRDINPGDKLKLGPLWDFDIAYGNYGDLRKGFIFNSGKISWGQMPQIARNLTQYNPEFVNRLVECWDKVYENGALTTYMLEKVDNLKTILWNSQNLNYTSKDKGGAGWSTNVDILQGWDTKTYDSYDEAVEDVKSFIQVHNAWLNTAIHQLKTDMTKSATYELDAELTHNSWDDARYFIPESYRGKICDVQIQNRTFKTGEWNTICLPFSLTKDQLSEKFGSNVQLLEYSGIIGTSMQFTPAADTRLVAGVPYLLKFSGSDVSNPSFSQVGVSCLVPATISYAENSSYSFTGTYFKTSISTDGTTLLLGSGTDAFSKNTSASTLTGLSAYITCPAGVTSMPIESNAIALYSDADNAEILAEYNGQEVDAFVNGLTLYQNNAWNTLCLPFSLAQLNGTPLAGATVKTLSEAAFKNGVLTLTFSDDLSAIEAGKPYIVKWASGAGISNPLFSGVTIDTSENPFENPEVIAFKGLYAPLSFKKAGDNTVLYLGSGGMLYYPNGKMTINAFHAYFQLLNGITAGESETSEAQAIRSFVLNFEGEEAAISEIYDVSNASAVADQWYTLDGRRLSSEPTTPGIYINSGRKIVIK